jgi:hypothetical protein
VVNIGRYRMLKDLTTGQVLKTKSEISALQAFMAWLEEAAASRDVSSDVMSKEGGEEKGGIILVSHEQDRQVLAPLLIQALEKYHLLQPFTKIVRGRWNSFSLLYKQFRSNSVADPGRFYPGYGSLNFSSRILRVKKHRMMDPSVHKEGRKKNQPVSCTL